MRIHNLTHADPHHITGQMPVVRNNIFTQSVLFVHICVTLSVIPSHGASASVGNKAYLLKVLFCQMLKKILLCYALIWEINAALISH